MKKKFSWVLLILGFAMMFIVITAVAEWVKPQFKQEPEKQEQTENQGETEEKKYPSAKDIIVYDIDGNKVKLSDYKGQPVVLNFWASWCGPCKREMPDFQKMYEEYGDEVVFLIVNLTDKTKETVETASAFIESMGYTFPVYYDTEHSAYAAYQVDTIPRTYLVNREGRIIGEAVGALNEESLQEGIKMLLEE